MTSLATLSIASRIATLTLNRPDARNSLSPDLLVALHERVAELERATDVSVVMLTGEGKAFCAGMDLKLVLADASAPAQLLKSLADLCVRLRRLPAVILAKVNGAAIGGGCGLATVCDLAITHADSKMGFPEVDLGVCPAVVAPWLVRKVGAGRAREILLRGGVMTGQSAFERGIVDVVVPNREALDEAAAEIVARLATGGPGALRATKSLLNELDQSLDDRLATRGAELSAAVLATPEAQAMLRAKLGS
jgi:methylglutaconyl-CoA hydratase